MESGFFDEVDGAREIDGVLGGFVVVQNHPELRV
jgi:hypothetical protein